MSFKYSMLRYFLLRVVKACVDFRTKQNKLCHQIHTWALLVFGFIQKIAAG